MRTEGPAAFLLLSSDREQAEISIPSQKQDLELTQVNPGSWVDGEYLLIAWKGYVLQLEGIPIFGGD